MSSSRRVRVPKRAWHCGQPSPSRSGSAPVQIAKLQLAIHERPTNPPPYRSLASCYALMGRLDDARETIARLRAITPVVIPHALPWRKPEHRDLWLTGLQLAMGEAN